MTMRRARRSCRPVVQDDLELLPLMNLFVAIIPMLLISAVFINISVIDMNAPADAADAAAARENLALTITIDDTRFVLEGRSIARTTIQRAEADADQQLASALAGIAGRYPDNQDVIVVSQPDTRYSDIVAVMDISREAGLPSVSLLGAE
jgi:biopolymer transport protein ExbD